MDTEFEKQVGLNLLSSRMAAERYRSQSYRWALSTIPAADQVVAEERQKDRV
jgi:hypothetical protein